MSNPVDTDADRRLVLLALALCGLSFGFVRLLLTMPAAVPVKLLTADAPERFRASGSFAEADVAEA